MSGVRQKRGRALARTTLANSVLGLAMLLGLPGAMGQATQPIPHRHIYPEITAAQSDINAGLKQARAEHKRVILDFGGDWCGDCQVLDIYFHDPTNLPLLEKNYVLVHVNVGRIDENLDIGDKYGVNLKKGVPALAVLNPEGKALYGQSGEFSDMRHMESASVTEFLSRWKGK